MTRVVVSENGGQQELQVAKKGPGRFIRVGNRDKMRSDTEESQNTGR